MKTPPRSRLLPATAVLVLVSAAARPARADWAVGAEGGYFGMNASKSAKAVFDGASGGGSYGGFLHFGLGPRFFVEAHGRYFSKTGQRVFVADKTSPAFPLGHPLTIRTIPVYGEVGYRYLTGSRWSPYVAAGAGATSYREESDVVGLVETQNATKFSGHFAAGVDFLSGPVRFGAEVGWSTVPNTIGTAGVSKVYGEKDVGGFTVLARVAFGSAP
jgi:outer membrane protein with beta-barrel domain